MLDDRPPPFNNSEIDLIRKEHTTLTQLISGHRRLPWSNESRIKMDTSLNVCADCDKTPHYVEHLFVFCLIQHCHSSIGSVLDFSFERLRVSAPLQEKVESEDLNVTIRAIN